MTKKPNLDLILFQGIWSLVLLLSHWMDLNHWKGYTAQRQGNTMIHVFWDLNFLCDYLNSNKLFYNSVTYLILLNKILLILTKRGFRWNQKIMNWHWGLVLYSSASCLCCLLYLHCLSGVTQTMRNTHWRFEMNFLWRKVWFNVRTSSVLWTVSASHKPN